MKETEKCALEKRNSFTLNVDSSYNLDLNTNIYRPKTDSELKYEYITFNMVHV